MKKLYVHIGTMKTGTTAIQDFLYANTEYLDKHGFVYPRRTYDYVEISPKRNGAFLGSPASSPRGTEEYPDELVVCQEIAQLKACFEKYDSVILSEETAWRHISSGRRPVWNHMVRCCKEWGVDVHVIVYLRRQDQFIESYWKQLVKHNLYRWSLQSCINNQSGKINMDYLANLDDIAASVGQENIHVRRYQRENLLDQDIVLDFLSLLGLPTDEVRDTVLQARNKNLSITNNMVAIARELNRIPEFTIHQHRRFEPALRKATAMEADSKRKNKYSMLTVEEAKALVEQYRERNDKLAAKYIGDGKPLFNDIYTNDEKWSRDNPYFTVDLIRFMGAAMNDMWNTIEKQDERIRKLEQESNMNPVRKFLHKHL